MGQENQKSRKTELGPRHTAREPGLLWELRGACFQGLMWKEVLGLDADRPHRATIATRSIVMTVSSRCTRARVLWRKRVSRRASRSVAGTARGPLGG